MANRTHFAFRAFLLSTCLLLPGAALAQQQGDEDTTNPTEASETSTAEAADAAAAVGAPEPTDPVQDGEETIVVTGIRAAERAALERKRNADQVSETLVADDVGKLPDQNVADATRRLAGISVANDQGEGRYVIIRGVDPDLANVTLNGQSAASPEPEGRQVKLDDIPSALIGSVQVIKSLTPDLDANAIAGQVNIDTISAFDRNRLFFNVRGAIGHYEINDREPYEGDATIGTVFGPDNQFGIVLSGNYSTRPIRSENVQGSTAWRTINGNLVPDDFRIRLYNLTRKRTGAVANFDWQTSDEIRLFLRGTYARFSDSETRDQFRIEIPTTITNQTATSGTFGARGTRFLRSREENTRTVSVSAGGGFDFGESHLDLIGTYTSATKRDPLRSESQFRTGNNAFTATYDLSDVVFNVTPSAGAYDPTLFASRQINFDTRQANEDLYQAKADLRVPIGLGDEDSYIKVGAKYLDRQKSNNRDIQVFTLSGFNASVATYNDGESIYNGRYPFGPRIDAAALLAFLAANPARQTLDVAGSRINSSLNDYEASEKVTSAYAMANLKFGQFTLIPGVRVEHTKGRFSAKQILPTSPLNVDFNVFGEQSYTDFFPGVNMRFDAARNLVLRGAVTTAIGRPNYFDLAPFVAIDTGSSPAAISLGNPDLQPLKSFNLDAAAEYYLPSGGVLAVALFYKKIDNPIYSELVRQTNVTFGGLNFATADILTPRNADQAVVKGIELNAQVQMSFLPSPLDGLGVGGNVTFVDSKVEGLLNRADSPPLFNQSNMVGTAQVYYEKYGLTARVAYSFRSRFLDTVGATEFFDQYTDDFGQLDARLSFAFNDNVTVFIEGANLNDEPFRRTLDNRRLLVENERYGRSYRGGVQVRF